MKKATWAALAGCMAVLGLGLGTTPAQGATDPLFVYTPTFPSSLIPPDGFLDGPCGLAVTSSGGLYLSDYYHRAVDTFSSTPTYGGQVLVNTSVEADHTGLVDDPCGLAVGPTGTLYVNNFHRNVVRFPPPISVATGTVIAGSPVDSSHPTGVAVDTVTGDLYVDKRTFIGVYDSNGAPVMDGDEPSQPLEIGLGSLEEGYGLAVSAYPATGGFLYVPDAGANRIEVFDPATSKVAPVQSIEPEGGFSSLRDAAVAVDRVNGHIYVVDNTQPFYAEQPQAKVDVFDSAGTFLGVLKYRIVDALPAGLAVDNSASSDQGRVYVTSGNTNEASVYGYPPGAETGFALPPVTSSASSARAALGVSASQAPSPSPPSSGTTSSREGAVSSGVAQGGGLRIHVDGKISPSALPRRGSVPISVSVGGEATATDGSPPPQLKQLRIEINRNGRLDYQGLPLCRPSEIQPASSTRALAACRKALVGRGRFSGFVSLPGQAPYPIDGRLLVFNGRLHNREVLLAHIYSRRPFTSSFVITFKISTDRQGAYGTSLTANLQNALGEKRNLTGMEMTLERRYSYHGTRHSFLSAGCPAPVGFPRAAFPLARTSFTFAGDKTLTSTVTSSCKVRK